MMSLPQLQLTELAGEPALALTVLGKTYLVSELKLSGLTELQKWLQTNVPHPIDRIKDHLDGLMPEERQKLLSEARHHANDWPPQVGSPEAAEHLMMTKFGQIETLYIALRQHHPDITRDEAFNVCRAIERFTARGGEVVKAYDNVYAKTVKEAEDGKYQPPPYDPPPNDGEEFVRTIYSTVFGSNLGLYESEERPILKKV